MNARKGGWRSHGGERDKKLDKKVRRRDRCARATKFLPVYGCACACTTGPRGTWPKGQERVRESEREGGKGDAGRLDPRWRIYERPKQAANPGPLAVCQPPLLFALYFDLSASTAYIPGSLSLSLSLSFSLPPVGFEDTPPFLWNSAKNSTFLFPVWTFADESVSCVVSPSREIFFSLADSSIFGASVFGKIFRPMR